MPWWFILKPNWNLPNMRRKSLQCVWLGPTSGGLGWLRRRLDHSASDFPQLNLRQFASIDMQTLRGVVDEGGVDRIVLACSTRLEYPCRELAFLQRDCPEIPFAVACESWWDGGRRTGLGVPQHLSLPWYRWWDGWSVWLSGLAPELFGPCQSSPSPWVRASWFSERLKSGNASRELSEVGCGMVVGNCRQTCDAWRLVVEKWGRTSQSNTDRSDLVEICSWLKYQNRSQANDFRPKVRWVLWDDSCLDTSAADHQAESMMEYFFQQASEIFPATLLIAAISLPRADQWLATSLADHQEFLVKPDSGQALVRLLHHRAPGFLA